MTLSFNPQRVEAPTKKIKRCSDCNGILFSKACPYKKDKGYCIGSITIYTPKLEAWQQSWSENR